MGIKFRLTEEDDNGDGFFIGAVQAPVGMPQDEAEGILTAAWWDFQATKPDASSKFGAWLVEHHGFTEIEDNFVHFVVGD